MSHFPLLASYSSQSFIVDGADFDGTNDYLLRGAGLTGASDSKLFTFVTWIKPESLALSTYWLDLLTGFSVANGSTNSCLVLAREITATSFVLQASSITNALTLNAWNCLMISVDLSDTAKRHMYVGDTNVASAWTTYTDAAINFTVTEVGIGATAGASSKYNGDMAELWFLPGEYIDFSVEANRRKFINSDGKPVNLGPTGSRPTGTVPLVYLHLDDAEAVANFAVNAGTGGNFAITGTLETSSTSPSD